MRIAVDIDSTLHDHWTLLSEAAERRFGITLPYEEQYSWGVTRLKPEQLAVCEADAHCDQRILASEPFPGAVAAINAWADAGHFVHVTSHRKGACSEATKRWLEQIDLHHDELHCSTDKLTRCREIDIDLLIDDAPHTLEEAMEHGISCATLLHPWNEELVEQEGGAILAASDWATLAALIEDRFPPLRRRRPAAAAAAGPSDAQRSTIA